MDADGFRMAEFFRITTGVDDDDGSSGDFRVGSWFFSSSSLVLQILIAR